MLDRFAAHGQTGGCASIWRPASTMPPCRRTQPIGSPACRRPACVALASEIEHGCARAHEAGIMSSPLNARPSYESGGADHAIRISPNVAAAACRESRASTLCVCTVEWGRVSVA
jgi:hypothetical protein